MQVRHHIGKQVSNQVSRQEKEQVEMHVQRQVDRHTNRYGSCPSMPFDQEIEMKQIKKM